MTVPEIRKVNFLDARSATQPLQDREIAITGRLDTAATDTRIRSLIAVDVRARTGPAC